MNVLVIGGGGREHALAWKVSQSPLVDRIFCAPGNAGIAQVAECVERSANDLPGLVDFAKKEKIDLTLVGPEEPLCQGITDLFKKEKLRIFGPSKAAAELEGSKVFSKNICSKYLIPSGSARTFNNAQDAKGYLSAVDKFPVVVKADGLAAGKGVIICKDRETARNAIRSLMMERKFGRAGDRILVEEFLQGEEASILFFTDGKTIAPLESSQDHKPVFDGDTGPNTGGMGAYSPAPVITRSVMRQIEEDILIPVTHAMNREGRPYKGILYAGLMLTSTGPKLLEFNVRFGDPETQPLLMRLEGDLVEIILAVLEGKLDETVLRWKNDAAVCVVLASKGYPDSYEKGFPISGLDSLAEGADLKVFHAGTALKEGKVVTAGGRVLGVSALGGDILEAKRRAYNAVKAIRFEGMHYRTDIADKALRRVS